MRLTALDIREQQFRRVMRGFDPDEVVTFLDAVANEYEQVIAENRDLRQRLLDLEHQIAEFQNMERALRDTLMTAERVTAETRDNAQKEAALILREAEVTAQQATAGISEEILQKRRELTDLQQRKKDYLLSLRGLAQSHLEMINSAARALESEALFAPGAAAGPARSGAPVSRGGRPPAAPSTTTRQAPPVGGPGNVPSAPSTAGAAPSPAAPSPGHVAAPPSHSPLPSRAGGVIPSAVPESGAPTDSSQVGREAGTPQRTGWAEASFDPGDLVPRERASGPVSAREAEHYRRGIAPEDPLPSLLRQSGDVTPDAPRRHSTAPRPPADADDVGHNSTQAVRPDGSQGD